MTLPLAPASLHRRLAGLLLCAMLLMQTVGQWHGVVHARDPGHAAHDAEATLPEPTGLEAWFAHHDDGAECQGFDQLSHADAPGFTRPDATVEHPALPRLCTPPLPNLAARSSGVQARGPPPLA